MLIVRAALRERGMLFYISLSLSLLNAPGPSLPTYHSTKDTAPPFHLADPDARKYDGERVICRVCNSWIFVGQVNQAAQTWLLHCALYLHRHQLLRLHLES